jgi:uncharacterized membrane protein
MFGIRYRKANPTEYVSISATAVQSGRAPASHFSTSRRPPLWSQFQWRA